MCFGHQTAVQGTGMEWQALLLLSLRLTLQIQNSRTQAHHHSSSGCYRQCPAEPSEGICSTLMTAWIRGLTLNNYQDSNVISHHTMPDLTVFGIVLSAYSSYFLGIRFNSKWKTQGGKLINGNINENVRYLVVKSCQMDSRPICDYWVFYCIFH